MLANRVIRLSTLSPTVERLHALFSETDRVQGPRPMKMNDALAEWLAERQPG